MLTLAVCRRQWQANNYRCQQTTPRAKDGWAKRLRSNNRLTNDGTFTYTYDDEGNRLTRVRISGAAADDKTVEYQWDYRNRLEKVTFKRNDGTVTKRVDYYYDMFNRWTKRVVDYDGDTGSAATRTDRMIHDGEEAIIQDFTENSDSHSFMHGPLGEMVIFDYHENSFRVPLGDHLNTIRDVVAHDGTDWNIVNHVTIDSFGRRIDESDDTIEVFHGLGGRPYDEETGLQNHVNRWYDPAVGRWLSEDPIGFGGGHANLSVYVGNSPLNAIDPNGLAVWGSDDRLRRTYIARGVFPRNIPFVVDDHQRRNNSGTEDRYGADNHRKNEFGELVSDVYYIDEPGAVAQFIGSLGMPGISVIGGIGPGFAPRGGGAIKRPGKLGGPAHRAKVAERAAELVDQNHTIEAGGGVLPERAVPTPGGTRIRRFPDITTRGPDGKLHLENIGLTDQHGRPVPREIGALDDIENAVGIRPVFTPYGPRLYLHPTEPY